MSRREELIIAASAALIARGRDDRYTYEESAAKAMAQAVELLELVDVQHDEEGDQDDENPPPFERGYELGEADAGMRFGKQIEELKAQIEALKSTAKK